MKLFANFEDAFFNKRESEQKVPVEVIHALSEKLPDGFFYTTIGKDTLIATPKNNPVFTFDKNKVELPKNLPKDFNPGSIQDLLEYLYRTQEKLKVIPDENNCITINGTKLEITEIIKSTVEDSNNVKKVDLYLVPEPFQAPFPIKLKNNKVTTELNIQRQPLFEMSKSKFQSVDNIPFVFTYIIDENADTIQFNFKLQLNNARNVRDIISTLELYYSFIKGEIAVEGVRLNQPIEVDSEQLAIQETIKFWKKVSQIENRLGITFNPEPEVKIKEALLIEKLYQSFVEHQPFKEYINIRALKIDVNEEVNFDNVINANGLSFQFIEKTQINLFGIELQLSGVAGWFDFKVNDVSLINKENQKYKLLLEPMRDKKIYKSLIYFEKDSEAKDFIKTRSLINKLQNADLLSIPFE